MKRYTLILFLVLGVVGCHRTRTAEPQPTAPKQIEFVMEGKEAKTRLVYDCNKFESQVKTLDDTITLRLRSVKTLIELEKDVRGNAALISSLKSALSTGDNLRLEQLVVTYECGKLLAAKR